MITSSIKRSELYARVWLTPLQRLGPELGLSDVGLSKLCKRHRIPVPPVGYWAIVAAGRKPPQPALPKAEDVQINLPTAREIASRAAASARAKQLKEAGNVGRAALDLVAVPMRETLEGCHPMVTKTAKFFNGIQPAIDKHEEARKHATAARQPFFGWMRHPRTVCGRYAPDVDGCLWISATLTHVAWILRFHDALLRGLVENGCRVRASEKRHQVDVCKGGETVNLKFSEDYEKVPSKAGRRDDSLSQFASDLWDYQPLKTFRLKMERQIGGIKEWRGRAEDLETRLPEIIRTFVMSLNAQGPQRQFMQAEAAAQRLLDDKREEERRVWFAAQKLIADRQRARTAQVARAKATSAAYSEFVAVTRLVAAVEARVADAPEGDAIWQWLAAVRENLDDPIAKLVRDVRLEFVDGKALWWPESNQVAAGESPGDSHSAGN